MAGMRTAILVWLVAVFACFVPVWLWTVRLPDCPLPATLRLPPAAVLDRAAPRYRVFVVAADSELAWRTSSALSQLLVDAAAAVDNSTFADAAFSAVAMRADAIRRILRSTDVEATLREARLAEEQPGLFDVFVVRAGDAGAQPTMDVGRGRCAWVVAADFAPGSAADLAAAVRAAVRPVERCWQSVRARVLGAGAPLVRPAEEYVLSFTLLFEDAGTDAATGRARGWDFAAAEARYLAALQAALAPAVALRVRSDVLRYARLNADVDTVERAGRRVHTLARRAVPFALQPRGEDWHVDRSGATTLADATVRTVVSCVVVVPRADHAPLYVADDSDRRGTLHDSVFVDDFGMLYVLNDAAGGDIGADALAGVFRAFVAHFRAVLGLSSAYVAAEDAVHVHYRGSGGVLRWEADAVAAASVCHAARRAARLHAALVAERADKRYIALPRATCAALAEAQRALDRVHATNATAAATPDDVHAAWRALALVEQATGRPDVTVVCDVPDEHLYALYLPLFGPVVVQLFTLVRVRVAHVLRKRRAAREHAETAN